MTHPAPQPEIIQNNDGTGGGVPAGSGAVPDLWTYRAVVVVLAVVLVAPVIGELAGQGMSQSTAPIVSAALGALAGLLAPSPTRHR
jgi:hypothetical protein